MRADPTDLTADRCSCDDGEDGGVRPVLALALVVVLAPSPAWAHGELRPDRVARGSTAQLDLLLPSERPSSRTTRVVLAMPVGFTALDCQEPVGWTCSVVPDAVEWRDVARVRAETDFLLTVAVPDEVGTYTLPVEQTYDDGTVNTFAGPPGSEDEAPVLTVTGAAPAPSSARPSATRSDPPRPSTRPSVSAPASSRPSAAASSSGTTAPPGSPSASGTASAQPSASEASGPSAPFARPSSLPRGELLGGGVDAGSSGLPLKVLAGGLVVLVGLPVLTRLARARRP